MMPILFIGHGSPENALEENEFTTQWKHIAQQFPIPKAVLCISAHWLTEGTAITSMHNPRTIHDFYGFSPQLYLFNYPAPGSPTLAKKIKDHIKTTPINLDYEWGLDHGTWSVLHHMYPQATIPILQLSIDYTLTSKQMFQLGQELSILRKENILIIGSGNIVHNLSTMHNSKAYPWAVDFDNFVKKNVTLQDHSSLLNYTSVNSASKAHLSPDHYFPLLYCLGATSSDHPTFFNEKIVSGSISMRCIKWDQN